MARAMKFSLSAFLRNLPFTQALNTSSVVKMQNLTDREISWLAFNQRVLELAEDKSLPLLERVRFLTIFSSNLDEFYMVRVASVLRKIENNISTINSAGYAPQELLAEIPFLEKHIESTTALQVTAIQLAISLVHTPEDWWSSWYMKCLKKSSMWCDARFQIASPPTLVNRLLTDFES